MWNLKNRTNEKNIAKQKQTRRYKNKLVGCQREVGGGSGEIGEGD